MKHELEFEDQCPCCGVNLFMVETDAPEGELADGDPVLCSCGQTGIISCDSETPIYINWTEYPEPTVGCESI